MNNIFKSSEAFVTFSFPKMYYLFLIFLFSCNERITVSLNSSFMSQPTFSLDQDVQRFTGLTSSSSYEMSGTCSTSDANIDLIIDGSVVESTTCTDYKWSATLDLDSKPDGQITIEAVQDRGNSDERRLAFEAVKDTIPPVTIDTSTTLSSEYNFSSLSGSFVISGNCSENGGVVKVSGVDILTQETTCVSGTFSLAAGLIGAADGNVPLDITLYDSAMNSVSSTLNVTKDVSLPTMSITHSGATHTNLSSYPVTINFSEPVTGFTSSDLILTNASVVSFTAVTSSSYTLEVVPTAAGSAGFEISALSVTDLLQNPNSQTLPFSIIYDVTAPTVTGLTSDASPLASRTWVWGCSEGANCTYRFVIDTSPSTNPTGAFSSTTTTSFSGNTTYYLHIQSRDKAGNISATQHYSFLFQDMVAPVLIGLSDDSVLTNSKTHVLDCVDASPCTYRYVIDQLPTTLPSGGYSGTTTVTTTTGNGLYYIHAQAQDAAGNESTVVHASFLIDSTAPVLTGLASDATLANTKAWSWGCVDVHPCSYRFLIDQAAGTVPSGIYGSTTSTSISSGDGTYYLHVQVRDTAGNTTLGHYSVTLDNTAPVLTGLSSDPVVSKEKTWTWGCTDTNTCNFRYVIDQNPTTTPTGAFGSISTASQLIGDGVYYLHVQSSDPVGNTSLGHYSVTLDNTPPAVLGLVNDDTPTASKSWSWSCSDLNTCTYRYTIDDNPLTLPTGAYSATTSAVYSAGFGYYYLHVEAIDVAGNISPVVHVYAPLDASLQRGGDVLRMSQYTGDGNSSKALNYAGYSPRLVWIKNVSGSGDHHLFLPNLGVNNFLSSNSMDALTSEANSLSSFGPVGFTLGSSSQVNASGQTYMSWAFKRNINFMDVVTYSGNGTHSRAISHSLGTSPGMIMIKNLSASSDWVIYQKDMNSGESEPLGAPVSPTRWVLNLNNPDARSHVEGAYFTNTVPTSTQFTLGSHAEVNSTSDNFLAILFAGDTSNVVRSGLYTGNGSTTGPSISLGYEPQWVMIKRKDSSGGWKIIDRNRSPANSRREVLELNSDSAQVTITGGIDFSSTGFSVGTSHPDYNASGGQYIYLVIGK